MIVKREMDFRMSLSKILSQKDKPVVVDIETSGLNVWNGDKLCGIGIQLADRTKFYYPFRHVEREMPLFAELDNPNPMNLPIRLLPKLLETLQQCSWLIGHNLKFDLAGLHQDGYDVPFDQKISDTIMMCRLYLHDKDDDLDLDSVVKTVLGITDDTWKWQFKAYLKKMKWQKHYDYAPPEKLGPYCLKDVENTYQLFEFLLPYLDETGQRRVFDQETDLLSVLWDMEKEGLYFDREYLVDRLKKLEDKLRQIEQQIYILAGGEFLVTSTKQLGEVMNRLGIHSPRKTDSGNESWGVAELMAIEHPIATLMLEYRGIEKMRSTYFAPLLEWVDDRQHPSFKPHGTITGRMSCSNPSLMNISKKTQELNATEDENSEAMIAIKAMMGAKSGHIVDMKSGSGNVTGGGSLAGLISYAKKYEEGEDSVAVRRLYIPPPNYILYAIDYSQMEMRVFGDYVDDLELLKLLDDASFDFHSHVAKEVWGVDETSSLWDFYRNLAKSINFGLIYGIGNKKLSSQIQKTEEEAFQYKKQYFSRFPKAETFMNKVKNVVETRGFLVNRFGRRYYIEADKSYKGVNYLVQGTSADIVKNRMVAVHRMLKGRPLINEADENLRQKYLGKKKKLDTVFNSKIVVQIHDEMLFYIHRKEEKLLVPLIRDLMEQRQIKTYLPVEVSKGNPSWAQKGKLCWNCWNPKIKGEEHICKKGRQKTSIGLAS